MATASTIIIAREDLSVPGSDTDKQDTPWNIAQIEYHFFDLLRQNRPDVVVLDLAVANGAGIGAIRKIREKSGVPILAVCTNGDPHAQDYTVAGAAVCLYAPLDLAQLNASIQHVIKLTRSAQPPRSQSADGFSFAGINYRPGQNILVGPVGTSVKLTTSENDLLLHLLSRSWTVCSRAELSAIIYRDHPPAGDRAIDVVVNRLRNKLAAAGSEEILKTEFRRGYILTADVTTLAV